MFFLFYSIFACSCDYEFKPNVDLNSYSLSTKTMKMYDSSNNPRYTLTIYNDNSYCIYDEYSEKVAEFSNRPNSAPISKNISYKVYYFGMNQIYVEKNGNVMNVTTGLDINFNDLADPLVKKEMATAALSNTDLIVPYGRYFSEMDGVKNKFPTNTNKDCGYVSEALLLSYYATFYNNSIICEHYMSAPVNNASTDVNSWNYFPCATQEFKDAILKKSVTNNLTIPADISHNIDEYLTQQFNSSYRYTSFGYPVNENDVKRCINLGKPVILFGDFSTSDKPNKTGKHAIVAYGVKNDMILANLGYANRSEVFVGFDYLGHQGGYVYIDTFNNIPHKHGGYTMVNGNYYCAKENKFVVPELTCTYSFFDSDSHICQCVCGKEQYLSHRFYITTIKKPGAKPQKVNMCDDCGYYVPVI